MPDSTYLLVVAGMGLVTYLPRWAPIFFLTRRPMHPLLVRWLELIPAAILSALLAPALLTGGEPRQIEWGSPELLVAVPTFLFALRTRSLGGTVVVGMLLYWGVGKVIV